MPLIRRKRLSLFVIVVLLLLASPFVVLLVRPAWAKILIGPWNDWAEISRYHEANAKMIASPDPNRVVFFGDSHIEAWRLITEFPGKPYVNRGIGGQTTAQMVVRFQPDVIALKPRAVLILGGTNDVLIHLRKLPFQQTIDNYAAMADMAKANNIKVIFAAVPSVNDVQGQRWSRRLETPDAITKLNEWLKNYCAANNYVFLDYYAQITDENGHLKESLSVDGEHFNLEGYHLISRLAEEAIKATEQ